MSPDKLTPELIAQQLAKMSHAQIYNQRKLPGSDQNFLAPYEHRAFTREETARNPLMALPLAVATPLYTAGKMLSPTNLDARSKPSLAEILQGYLGIGEGLKQRFTEGAQ